MTTTTVRILIVDDNVNVAQGFAVALERAGYDASVALTAQDGLRLATDQPPDAIILDFRMPFVNGVGLLYRLRQLPTLREVPVMVITGAPVDDETRMDLQHLHASLRFKPLAFKDLLEDTHGLVTQRRTAHPSIASNGAN